jgi:hypothetical protein
MTRLLKNRSHVIIAVITVALALTVAAALVLTRKFPYSREAVMTRLENRTGARVEIQAFREKWFPPGFIARGLRLSRRDGAVLTVSAATLTGSYTGLLRSPKRVPDLHLIGLHLLIPKLSHTLLPKNGSKTDLGVENIEIENAQLDISTEVAGKPPLTFMIPTLRLEHAGTGKPVSFHVFLHNPRPSGYIRSDGQFGPVNASSLGETPVSGAFTFENADLTVQRAISGLLYASGNFHGRLRSLECTGTADVPRFQVFGSSHAVHIASRFKAAVDATTGNAALDQVVAHFNSTTVSATGKVMNTPNRAAKTVALDLSVHQGRVDDILLLFTHASTPAMEGPIGLHGRFTIPPGPPDFLTRIKIDGNFDIARGRFTNPKTQSPIDRLSQSAAGASKREQRDEPRSAAAEIRASVSDRNGVASLSNIVFEAAGIRGRLEGTFALHDKAIDMSGNLETSGKISNTTSGIKALALKGLATFWPKRMSVRTIPFQIGGNASHPVFRLKLHGHG